MKDGTHKQSSVRFENANNDTYRHHYLWCNSGRKKKRRARKTHDADCIAHQLDRRISRNRNIINARPEEGKVRIRMNPYSNSVFDAGQENPRKFAGRLQSPNFQEI